MNKLTKAYKMFRYYRQPIETLINNILEVCDRYDSPYTIPIVGSMAEREPDFVKSLYCEKRIEVASHGYKHVRYSDIGFNNAMNDLIKSKEAFGNLGIEVYTFRAPYNSYILGLASPMAANFKYDIGHMFRDEYQHIVHPMLSGGLMMFPVSQISDDRMLDRMGLSVSQAVRMIGRACLFYAMDRRVVSFDLHPIRIGRKENIPILKGLLDTVEQNDGCLTTTAEYATKYRPALEDFDFKFYVIPSGDIDQWGFLDYLRRG